MATIQMAIDEIHRAYNELNTHYYNGELPEVAILIQNQGNRKGIAGWCTVDEIWHSKDNTEHKYEINICAEYLNRTPQDICETLLHEMVHLYDLTHGVKDVSRGTAYHNKRYKDTAEQHGLIVNHHPATGWALTQLNAEALLFIGNLNLNPGAFSIARIGAITNAAPPDIESDGGTAPIETPKKKKGSYRRYVCPSCGVIVRATKDVNLTCTDCSEALILQEKDTEM